jgi:hypothetical protein
LSDGATYDIPDAYYASITVTEVTVGVDPHGSGIPQRSVYIDTRHVTRMEPIADARASRGNAHNPQAITRPGCS